MPIAPRVAAPPTDVVLRGQARLLAQLSAMVAGPGDPTLASELPGSESFESLQPRVGDEERYEFGEVFAAGGLGLVRRGEDRRLGRPIAIKELLRDSPQAARRFALEAAITARLQHPGIVPLYDLGWQGNGKPYYCMQLVDGESLATKIAEATSLAARLRLVEHVIAVADAIAYAHERQIIHRDIKPANVLVGRFGETIVIDWGLAKDLTGTIGSALDGEPSLEHESDLSGMTEAGTVMGTLRYMAPEQARGEAVSEQSDVYSLGAMLYHVLAGEPPFADGERDQLVYRVIAGELQPLLAIDPAIPSELAAIAERAMALAPEQRYASAIAFAEDLRSFQAGRMVSAHAYSIAELIGRWLRHHRVIVSASVLALVAVAVVGVVALRRVRDERALAAKAEAAAAAEAERAERVAFERSVVAEAKLAGEVLVLAQAPGRELEALARGVEVVASHAPSYEQAPELAIAGLSRALAGVIPLTRFDLPLAAGWNPFAVSADGSLLVIVRRTPTTAALQIWSLEQASELVTVALDDPKLEINYIEISPDNTQIVISKATRCTIFDVQSGARTLELDGCAEPVFARDGRTLFGKVPGEVQSGTQTYGALAAWDSSSGTQRWVAPMPGQNFVIVTHPDGERLIVRTDHLAEERVQLRSTATGEQLATLVREPAQPRRYTRRTPAAANPDCVALSPDGRTLAVGESDEHGSIVLWDLQSQQPTVLDIKSRFASSLAFSGDGRWLLVGGGSLRAYDLERHELVTSLTPSGAIASRRLGGLAIVADRWLELPRGHSHQSVPPVRYRAMQGTHDDRFMVTSADGEIRVWSSDDHLALERWTPPAGETIVEFGAEQILTRDQQDVRRVHARADRTRAPIILDVAALGQVVSHASERPSIVTIQAPDRSLEVHDLASGERRCSIPSTPKIRASALSPDGETLVSIDMDGLAHIWALGRCRERVVTRLFDRAEYTPAWDVLPIHFVRNGTIVLTERGHITIVDPGDRVRELDNGCTRGAWASYSVASPDGRLVMSSCHSSQMNRGAGRLWDVERGQVVGEIELLGYTSMPVFSDDGELLIFAVGSRELAVVRVADGRELLRIPTRELPERFASLRVRAGLPIVDVVTLDGELVSYPITRAQLVEAACRVLARSELATRTADHCGG